MNIIQFLALTNTCKVQQIHCGSQNEGSLRWISCWYSNTRTCISLHVWHLFWGERSRTLPLGSWPCQLVFATSSLRRWRIGGSVLDHTYTLDILKSLLLSSLMLFPVVSSFGYPQHPLQYEEWMHGIFNVGLSPSNGIFTQKAMQDTWAHVTHL